MADLFEDQDAELVMTSSRIRVWWPVRFFDYRIKTRLLHPRSSLFGSTRFTPRWGLSAPSQAQVDRL